MGTVIERLEKLADGAMVRPWRNGIAGYIYDAERVPVLVVEDGEGPDVQDDNAEFIVAAVNALPDLLKLARAARAHSDADNAQRDWNIRDVQLTQKALFDALEPLFREDPS